jgi:hypothetical protein
MTSISKTYQTKVQGMSIPSEPETSSAVCQQTTDYHGHPLGRDVKPRKLFENGQRILCQDVIHREALIN